MNDMHPLWKLCSQFVKFSVVGFANTFISLIIYYIFIFIDKKLYVIGWLLGFLAGVMNAYFWNSRYVFGNSSKISHIQLTKTLIAYGGTAILSFALLNVLIIFLAVSEWLAPLIILFITVPLNFALNKFWTFGP